MLNLLEPLELAKREFLGPDHIHLLVQAKQIAYQDRDRWLADPGFAAVPIERLVSKAYADSRRPLIDPARALPWTRSVRGQPRRRHGVRRRGGRRRAMRPL
jgi:gamma-glutamyltranspeptidase/glutathione hydrolase